MAVLTTYVAVQPTEREVLPTIMEVQLQMWQFNQLKGKFYPTIMVVSTTGVAVQQSKRELLPTIIAVPTTDAVIPSTKIAVPPINTVVSPTIMTVTTNTCTNR